MHRIFDVRVLFFSALLVSPAVAAWVLKKGDAPVNQDVMPVSIVEIATPPVARVPVEIRENGSKPQWVYVQVQADSIPEPGMISLLAIAGLFTVFLRRR